MFLKTHVKLHVYLSDTYMEAHQILKKALTCSTSDLQTEDEQERPGRRRTTAKSVFFLHVTHTNTNSIYFYLKKKDKIKKQFNLIFVSFSPYKNIRMLDILNHCFM